jgi:hypothetical protein
MNKNFLLPILFWFVNESDIRRRVVGCGTAVLNVHWNARDHVVHPELFDKFYCIVDDFAATFENGADMLPSLAMLQDQSILHIASFGVHSTATEINDLAPLSWALSHKGGNAAFEKFALLES